MLLCVTFFFNAYATTDIYTYVHIPSLPAALPISSTFARPEPGTTPGAKPNDRRAICPPARVDVGCRRNRRRICEHQSSDSRSDAREGPADRRATPSAIFYRQPQRTESYTHPIGFHRHWNERAK